MRLDIRTRDIGTIAAVIARSQIVVPARPAPSRLPAGFDRADLAILEWIAAEARRASRDLPRI